MIVHFKSLLPRAIAISTVKDAVYTALSIWGVLFIFGNVPMKVYTLIFGIIFFLNTFLFAEWMFRVPVLTPRKAALVVFVTYVWDVLLNILIWSFLADINLFAAQSLPAHLAYFTVHAAAMAAAFYDRRRLGTWQRGPTEGLAP